ncbi:TetR/AcrR family transcriptional regulator [Kitasatospora sp. NPDC058444]|uniref:TetR/AcrR family transcriptional regulator n=1 Tax=Kitasatospora sp. NPDC058444 TaxID=3346504 RepID=UPI00364E8628
MARKPAAGIRERILDAAARLFDQRGVHAVGMQQIIDEVGCGKQSLYREFPGKDQLVVAYLERSAESWDRIVADVCAAVEAPEDRLVELVRTVQGMAPNARGCPLRNTHAEFPDPDHPAHQVSLKHFRRVREQLRDLARRTPAADPDRLGDRIMLIIDGVYVNGWTSGSTGAAEAAVGLASDVVRAEIAAAAG